MLSELSPGGYDRSHGKDGCHDQEDAAANHWSPVVGGSEAAAEGTAPVASNAEPQANTNATPPSPVRTPKETPACVNGP